MFPRVLFSSKKTEWGTPFPLFSDWHNEFRFTLDPCTIAGNPLGLPKFFTIQDDGLSKSWRGERVFVNPPYGRSIRKWVLKCYNEWKFNGVELIALLIPNRSDTVWYHDFICSCEGNPKQDGSTCSGTRPGIEVRKIAKRIKFVDLENGNMVNSGSSEQSATFASVLIIFKQT